MIYSSRNKQILYQFYEVWQTPGVSQLINFYLRIFIEINHLSGDIFLVKRHLYLFESTVLNGPTIAWGPVAVFGQQHSQTPLETQRTSPPSPEGHYFWLWPQGQPADLPKGQGPAPQPLTGFTAYPELTAMTTACTLAVHWGNNRYENYSS